MKLFKITTRTKPFDEYFIADDFLTIMDALMEQKRYYELVSVKIVDHEPWVAAKDGKNTVITSTGKICAKLINSKEPRHSEKK